MSGMKESGWIGVDLDGTLAHYTEWTAWNAFGKPIQPMVDRVRRWLADGITVKIVTARVRPFNPKTDNVKTERCYKTGTKFSNRDMMSAIQDWTEKHIGKRLPVTCSKDVSMVELWDDRAVQVVSNTGRTLAEEHESHMAALSARGPTRDDVDGDGR